MPHCFRRMSSASASLQVKPLASWPKTPGCKGLRIVFVGDLMGAYEFAPGFDFCYRFHSKLACLVAELDTRSSFESYIQIEMEKMATSLRSHGKKQQMKPCPALITLSFWKTDLMSRCAHCHEAVWKTQVSSVLQTLCKCLPWSLSTPPALCGVL